MPVKSEVSEQGIAGVARSATVAVNGTIFILHEEAAEYFKNLKPDQFLQNHIASTYAQKGIDAVKRELRRDYECKESDGKFYVLEPKPNEDAFSTEQEKTKTRRLGLKSLQDVVRDEDGNNHIVRGSAAMARREDTEALCANLYEAPSASKYETRIHLK